MIWKRQTKPRRSNPKKAVQKKRLKYSFKPDSLHRHFQHMTISHTQFMYWSRWFRSPDNMTGHDSKYFSTTKKGEIPELKEELNSQYKVFLTIHTYHVYVLSSIQLNLLCLLRFMLDLFQLNLWIVYFALFYYRSASISVLILHFDVCFGVYLLAWIVFIDL